VYASCRQDARTGSARQPGRQVKCLLYGRSTTVKTSGYQCTLSSSSFLAPHRSGPLQQSIIHILLLPERLNLWLADDAVGA
jgi:hypothetical protein